MPALLDVQRRLRDAIVGRSSTAVAPLLIGGADPGARLAIHRRHHETSLVTALLEKFPATTWLVGSSMMVEAAKLYVARQPPSAPCIAEYGEDFPTCLASRAEAQGLAYVRWFAELEWHLGQVSIAIDQPAIGLESFADCRDRLTDVVLVAQPGVRYLASPWPIDDLMKMYLTDAFPNQYTLSSGDIWLEICGSRGCFRFDRLEHGEFVFRQAVTKGIPLGAAADQALGASDGFDVGAALQRFVTDGLVTQIRLP